MKILVDVFGGDNAPDEIIEGALLALKERKDFSVELVGDSEIISEKLKNLNLDQNFTDRITILHAKDFISCEEEPTLAIRRKPESSICVAFKELKENEQASAFVSAGSTGAVLVGATLKLGRISGINRPALCPTIPTLIEGKNVFLTDSGANADCKSINLCQFALMASIYAKTLGVENPKVALLSNGTEDEKGNLLIHETLPLLKEMKEINFVGNVEGRDILSGEYDIVISDGFSGNIALKSMEGAINTIFTALRQGIYGSFKGKIGGALLKGTFNKLKDRLDYNNKGGAIFLGVKKPVVKAHGSSKRVAIKNAILQAVLFSESRVCEKIENSLINSEQLWFLI